MSHPFEQNARESEGVRTFRIPRFYSIWVIALVGGWLSLTLFLPAQSQARKVTTPTAANSATHSQPLVAFSHPQTFEESDGGPRIVQAGAGAWGPPDVPGVVRNASYEYADSLQPAHRSMDRGGVNQISSGVNPAESWRESSVIIPVQWEVPVAANAFPAQEPSSPTAAVGNRVQIPTDTESNRRSVPAPELQTAQLSPYQQVPLYAPGDVNSAPRPPYGHSEQQPPRTALEANPNQRQQSPLPPGQAVRISQWWQPILQQQTIKDAVPVPVGIESLVTSALVHSPFIRIAQREPLIRQTVIRDEVAQFDWKAFVETRYDDFSDPVGNTLTTGGSPRFRDNHMTTGAGVKQRTDSGGEFRIGQQFGLQNTNSIYFVPSDQGSARLELSYAQPLLNRAGRAYNRSHIVLAEIDASLSDDETRTLIQNQLLKVTETYWQLYRARAVYLQKAKLVNGATEILELLEARRNIDAIQRQTLRARAAVATRGTLMARADAEIRNAESQLRLLVKDPAFAPGTRSEMIPQEAPLTDYIHFSLEVLRQDALQFRPEITAAMKNVHANSVRLDVSKRDLLPKLDFLLTTYVAGLQGRNDIADAYVNQFSVGEPGYTVGLSFEIPLGNRVAKARRDRRELELSKTMIELEATIDTSLTEVELAYREIETAYAETVSESIAVQAAISEERYLFERWRLMPGDDRTTTLLLENLLESQERLALAEERFVTAQVRYVTAIAHLKRSTGTLFQLSWGTESKQKQPPPGAGQTMPAPPPSAPAPAVQGAAYNRRPVR